MTRDPRLSALLPVGRAARRAATAPGTSLGSLADALGRELEPLLAAHAQGTLPIPDGKARLTRIGGRCPVHGGLLEFNPWEAHRHRCIPCGRDWRGADHDGWWLLGAHFWTMERAVHAALLFALRGDQRHAALARAILEGAAARYAHWPNRDNVLGPSRPFFSTYLEAIWLLNACHALALLEGADPVGSAVTGARLRDQLVAPGAALVAGFPEGRSNRQAWNSAALLGAARLLDAPGHVLERHAATVHDLVAHGLLDDGSWYEGENYHLFAHRGLWFGAQQLAALDRPLPPPLLARLRAGFVAPFAGVLPDDTFPSRRDAPYRVSIRQWRVAEWLELGWAMEAGSEVAALLTRLYDAAAAPPGLRAPDERARSTADGERPTPAARLTRADLSWRALVAATPEPPPPVAWTPRSRLLAAQGVAALRRETGQVYVALEGGHGGGDHGHPDRLALTLQRGPNRWLEDPGAGSYTSRTLHWYRSTLAHHAPLVDGRSQAPGEAHLLAWEERGGAGWVWKRATLAPGVVADRAVVVCDGYLVDRLAWTAPQPVTLSLPLAADAEVVPAAPWTPVALRGGDGLEDGFDVVVGAEQAPVAPGTRLRVPAPLQHGTAATACCWLVAPPGAQLVRGWVPGPPGLPPRRRTWVQSLGTGGVCWSVWAWPDDRGTVAVRQVTMGTAPDGGEAVVVTTACGTSATHHPAEHGWHIALAAGGARSSIDLEGRCAVHDAAPPSAAEHAGTPPGPVVPVPLVTCGDVEGVASPAGALVVELGEPHYVATEQSWHEAAAPTAQVALAATATHLVVTVQVHTGAAVPPDAAENRLDNEHPEVNADGVQWYLGHSAGAWSMAGLALPVAGPGMPHRRLVPGPWPLPVWHAEGTRTGWAMRLAWPLEQLPRDADGLVPMALVVNERPPERARRRGQLVLTGGGGFGYLRGDRHDPAAVWRLRLPAGA
jgi:hypothetical protein